MSFKARVEFHTGTRHYHVGDEVTTTDINMNIKEMCMVSTTPDAVVKYTVTFLPNGASGDNVVKTTEGYLVLPECKFTPQEGHTFAGWALATNGVGKKAAGAKVNITHDTSYYAIWNAPKEVTISFDHGAGKGKMESVKVVVGTKVTLPECTFTAPDGHEFKGWSVDGSSIITELTADKNTVVTALWQATPQPPSESE